MRGRRTCVAAVLLSLVGTAAQAQSLLTAEIDAAVKTIEPKVIAWRRDIHQNPELGNREVRTAKLAADHLRRLGFEVRTGVAGTGVVGVLKGGRPGPVVALRADMDALPVKEENALPFRSRATATYQGRTVPVMHACGHDVHVAILMGAAEVLAGTRDRLPGTLKVIFQPAEEGPSDFEPDGKRTWGARLMVDQGVMDAPKVDAVFGLHVATRRPTGSLGWRAGPMMASADLLKISVQGRQTHGARPWAGVDPIVVGSQIVMGLQTVASRQVEVTKEPSVVTIGTFNAGLRNNIISDRAEMQGTIRTFDTAMQDDIHRRIERTATMIAESAGAKAEVSIVKQYPPTVNDPALTARMEPTLKRVAGEGSWQIVDKVTGSEDFAFYGERAPALFVFLGVTAEMDLATAAPNHSPLFVADEGALSTGVRALAHLTVDYMEGGSQPR